MPRPRYGGQVYEARMATVFRRAGTPNPYTAARMARGVRDTRNVKPNPSYGGHQWPNPGIPNYPTGGGGQRRYPWDFLPLDGL